MKYYWKQKRDTNFIMQKFYIKNDYIMQLIWGYTVKDFNNREQTRQSKANNRNKGEGTLG